MPELPDMLAELIRDFKNGDIEDCYHNSPALTEEWCDACFIKNHQTVSLDEPFFTEETSIKQRETIQKIWGRLCNDEEWEDFDD